MVVVAPLFYDISLPVSLRAMSGGMRLEGKVEEVEGRRDFYWWGHSVKSIATKKKQKLI